MEIDKTVGTLGRKIVEDASLTRKRKDDIMIKLSERSQGQAREREDLNARQRRFTEPGIERKNFPK
ncbi:MAG: hypothetical protein IJ010_05920, partial [Ruminococcus sp.]|nr:hypothetical protein [Ruminococcus sp.]